MTEYKKLLIPYNFEEHKDIYNKFANLNNNNFDLFINNLKIYPFLINETKHMFSIIMPAYNSEHYIIKSIESIIQQTYTLWELIIVDDCSTDNTFNIVDTFIKNNPQYNIKLLKTPKNSGAYYCMNLGIINSIGEYITRIDSDDVFDPNKLMEQYNQLIKDNIIIAITKYKRVYNHNNKYDNKRGGAFGEVTLAYKRFILMFIGFYDTIRFAADSEFKQRIKKYFNKNTININKILYFAMKRKNSLTTSKKTGQTGKGRLIRKKYVVLYKRWHRRKLVSYMPLNFEKKYKCRTFPIPDITIL